MPSQFLSFSADFPGRRLVPKLRLRSVAEMMNRGVAARLSPPKSENAEKQLSTAARTSPSLVSQTEGSRERVFIRKPGRKEPRRMNFRFLTQLFRSFFSPGFLGSSSNSSAATAFRSATPVSRAQLLPRDP